MYQEVNFCNFEDAFHNRNRGNNFSYDGLQALYNYLTQLEEDLGEQIELDVIALCCEYSEINRDEETYKDYVGEDAHLDDCIIADLGASILVREG